MFLYLLLSNQFKFRKVILLTKVILNKNLIKFNLIQTFFSSQEPVHGDLETLSGSTLISALRNTLSEMQSERSHNVYRPIELFNSLKRKTAQFTDGDQHDSQELLRHLLEAIRNEDVRVRIIFLQQLNLIFTICNNVPAVPNYHFKKSWTYSKDKTSGCR